MATEPQRSTGRNAGRLAGMALLGAAAFVGVTMLSFFIASNAGDETATPAGGEPVSVTTDVAGIVAVTDGSSADTNGLSSQDDQGSGADGSVIDADAAPTLVGTVATVDGATVAAVEVHLFVDTGDSTTGDYLHTALTGDDGAYEIAAPVGCYIVRFDAPAGMSFVDAGPNLDVPTCINATIVRVTVDATIR